MAKYITATDIVAAGACSGGVREWCIKSGVSITTEEIALRLTRQTNDDKYVKKALGIDGNGDGDGYGNGYGYCDGYGDGNGDGNGDGYGDGDGDGDGYGNGDGDGDGDGYGI